MSNNIDERIFQMAKEQQQNMIAEDPDNVMPLTTIVDFILEGILSDISCMIQEEEREIDIRIAAIKRDILRSEERLKQLQLQKDNL